METDTERFYNVYMSDRGQRGEHVARMENMGQIENYMETILNYGNLGGDIEYLVEVEVVQTTRRITRRYLPDGTYKLAK